MSEAPSYRPIQPSPLRNAVVSRAVALSQPFVAGGKILPSHFQRRPFALVASPVSDFTAPVDRASPLAWSFRSSPVGRSPYETNIHQRSPTRRSQGSFTAIAFAMPASSASRRAAGSNESGLPASMTPMRQRPSTPPTQTTTSRPLRPQRRIL